MPRKKRKRKPKKIKPHVIYHYYGHIRAYSARGAPMFEATGAKGRAYRRANPEPEVVFRARWILRCGPPVDPRQLDFFEKL
jgi:hypothetical protein